MNNINDLIDSKIFKEIISNKIHCYFISPHLDDAVFSTANVISHLIKNGVKVTVINVFTKPSPKPYTLSVRRFLSVCGYVNADELFIDRIAEDEKVLKEIGVDVINLGFVDALWRRKSNSIVSKLFAKYIPESDYVYPVYRLSIALGRIAKADSPLIGNVQDKLKSVIKNPNISYVFCPIAIGKHVDHIIVRDLCNKTFDNVIYWADYPYSEESRIDAKFVESGNLEENLFNLSYPNKNSLISGYKSQQKIIFGLKTDHRDIIERYFTKKSPETEKNIKRYNLFPPTLDGFKFKELFNGSSLSDPYQLAIYVNDDNKKVIVKMCKGYFLNTKFKWLLNEISVYRFIHSLKSKTNIKIPRTFQIFKNDNSLYFAIQYIEGQTIANLSSVRKARIFGLILKYFKVINSKSNKIRNFKIAKRGPIYWISILPILSIIAIFKFPRHFKSIVKANIYTAWSIPSLLKRKDRCLIHRDLNDNNVLRSNGQIFLIDFELACIADPLLEYAILLLKYRLDEEFIKEFNNIELFKSIINHKNSQTVIKAYMLIFAIYDLIFLSGFHDASIAVLNKFNNGDRLI